MANKLRGEVSVPGTVYALRYDVNTLCEIEDRFDMTFVEIVTQLQESPRVTMIRTLFWYGLQGAGKKALSEIDAGEIISNMGIKNAALLITASFEASNLFDTEEEGDKSEGES